MKYCPNCGDEYRVGFDRCADCGVLLVDEPVSDAGKPTPQLVRREVVFTTGRRIDAEMVRGMLETNGFDALIWAGGMGVWRMESALTEMTGVPNDFNSYRVVVLEEDAEEARALLLQSLEAGYIPGYEDAPDARGSGLMQSLAARSALIGFALFLVIGIILFGPPN